MNAAIAVLMLIVCQAPGGGAPEGVSKETPASAPAAKHNSVVTSDRLDVDRANDTALFTGRVHVKDPDGEMWADRMEVFYEHDSHKVRKIVCTGEKVIIVSRGKRSRSNKAVYTAADGKIVLTGDPHISHGKNVYGADRITMFKDTDRVIFEPKARMIFYSEEGGEGIDGFL